MSDEAPESDFQRESSRLNEGLRSCRAVMDNYRAMMLGDQLSGDGEADSSELSNYVLTSASTAEGYSGSGAN